MLQRHFFFFNVYYYNCYLIRGLSSALSSAPSRSHSITSHPHLVGGRHEPLIITIKSKGQPTKTTTTKLGLTKAKTTLTINKDQEEEEEKGLNFNWWAWALSGKDKGKEFFRQGKTTEEIKHDKNRRILRCKLWAG